MLLCDVQSILGTQYEGRGPVLLCFVRGIIPGFWVASALLRGEPNGTAVW